MSNEAVATSGRATELRDNGALVELASFRLELRQFFAFSEAACKSAGVTSQQYQALLALRAEGDTISMKELASLLSVAPNGTVQLVDRMEVQSLVRRQLDPADARRVQVGLTAKGKQIVARLAAIHLAELRTRRAALIACLQALGSADFVESKNSSRSREPITP